MYTGQGSGGILTDGQKMCQDEGLLLRCRGCRYHYRYPTLYATAAAAVEAENLSEGESDCFHSVWARNFVSSPSVGFWDIVTKVRPSACISRILRLTTFDNLSGRDISSQWPYLTPSRFPTS